MKTKARKRAKCSECKGGGTVRRAGNPSDFVACHSCGGRKTKVVRPKKKSAPATSEEVVSIDELGSRYARDYKRHLLEGGPARSAENHFRLALLFLSSKQFRPLGVGLEYAVPGWSSFSKKSIESSEAKHLLELKKKARL